jgi:hypothetical protein
MPSQHEARTVESVNSTRGVKAVRRLLALTTVGLAAGVLAAPAMGDGTSPGPPGGTIYAFDQAYRTVATPTSLPDRGAFDTIYVFPDCSACASVSEAAPGHRGYNGGRWRVVQASGITSQLTNAADVVAAASGLTDTGIRFVCPLIRA